jgi:shikimate kinase
MKGHVFIIGFMGAGKTTFGLVLAEKFALPFIDIDKEIECKEGKSIVEIFSQKGEHYFRNLELKFIDNLPNEPHVISCGGGLPCYNDNILKLKKLGKVVFLNTDFEFIYSRILKSNKRPLVATKSNEEIEDLFDKRKIYYQLSDLEIDNSLSLDELIKIIYTRII